MRYLIILLVISFCSCKKDINDATISSQASIQSTDAATLLLSDTPHLYIPELEYGYSAPFYNGGEGLTSAGLWSYMKYATIRHQVVSPYFSDAYFGKVPIGSTVKIINYACDIANGIEGDTWDTTINNPITRSGIADYKAISGIQPTPLSIVTYANGDVYLGRKKDEFSYTPSFGRLGAPNGINYHGDTSFIWWGWVDRYWNNAIIPEQDGKYVIAVTLDYGKINPKTSLLPINVIGDYVELDTTAIELNAAHPATNYKAVLQRGKIKGVNISWEGNGYAYCIERDGVMIVKWQDIRSYYDVNGNKFSTYKIITRAQGRIPDAETPIFKVTK